MRWIAILLLSACGPTMSPRVDSGSPDLGVSDLGSPDAGPVGTACDTATAATIATVAMLPVGRYSPAVALLADHTVLVGAGYDFARGAQFSMQIFDPATNSLFPTGDLFYSRNFPAVARLANGWVIVAGGFSPTSGSVTHVELYDPSRTVFATNRVSLHVGREAHTATLLADGRVLIAGGLQAAGFTFHDTAELFDPMTGAITLTATNMSVARAFHSATWIESRASVLIVGGDTGHGESATAERYVVADDNFVPLTTMRQHAGKAVAAALLDDGRVLVAGGANATDGTLADADLYDPTTDALTPAAAMHTRRMAFQLTRLADGRVLASGGWSDSTMPSQSAAPLEVYDPRTDSWELLPISLANARQDHIAVLLDDCRVAIFGGEHAVSMVPPTAPLEVEVITVPTRP